MARMKFLCDAERCIECNACVTACKNEHEVPWGINRRRVVTIDDGIPGEKSISVACMHCTDAPCQAVCPVDCFYTTADGVVFMPFHFGGHYQGKDLIDNYPEGTVPHVRGESCNTVFTYGYDSVTAMQETKVSLCRIRAA